jgi:hypothetical protein
MSSTALRTAVGKNLLRSLGANTQHVETKSIAEHSANTESEDKSRPISEVAVVCPTTLASIISWMAQLLTWTASSLFYFGSVNRNKHEVCMAKIVFLFSAL